MRSEFWNQRLEVRHTRAHSRNRKSEVRGVNTSAHRFSGGIFMRPPLKINHFSGYPIVPCGEPYYADHPRLSFNEGEGALPTGDREGLRWTKRRKRPKRLAWAGLLRLYVFFILPVYSREKLWQSPNFSEVVYSRRAPWTWWSASPWHPDHSWSAAADAAAKEG